MDQHQEEMAARVGKLESEVRSLWNAVEWLRLQAARMGAASSRLPRERGIGNRE